MITGRCSREKLLTSWWPGSRDKKGGAKDKISFKGTLSVTSFFQP
jgi:hypothetical protein